MFGLDLLDVAALAVGAWLIAQLYLVIRTIVQGCREFNRRMQEFLDEIASRGGE